MYDYHNPPYGLVGYANSKKGWLSFLQHVFAGPGASHAFITTFPIGKTREIPMIFEAVEAVAHTPYARYLGDGPVRDWWLFTMPELSDYEIVHSIEKCTEEFSAVTYGFLQWPWFVWRWFEEKILHNDWRHKRNWFTQGVICTEVWYWFIMYATELEPSKHSKIRAILDQWEPDSIQAYDVKMIMTKNPDIFKPFGKYENGIYTQLMEI